MIKHFGRWVFALMLALMAAAWFIERTVAEATITRALWVIYVVSPVAMLFIVERRRGARPGVLTIVATLVAAAVFAWILLELDARWWVQALLITVLATPIANIRDFARFYR